ncbi:MAG: DegV family protein [Clostridia bacterium]|nr:DegV family protein [Clostridia bacterium]
MKIHFSADSTCDVSPEFLARYPVEILPLSVELEGKFYRDGVDLTPDTIISRVNAGAALPKTSAVNVEEYRTAFTRALESSDAVIHFNISSEFSSCHQNACLAAEGLNVWCIDSRNLSTGITMLLAEGFDRAEAGEEPEQIARELRERVDKVDVSFIVDRLDYLYKGGRCSALAMLGANVLHIRPCIEVKDGKMGVCRKYRGTYERCLRQYIADRMRTKDDVKPRRIFLTHTGVAAQAVETVRELVLQEVPFAEVYEVRAGCSITSHCGENTFGIIMYHE